MSLLTSAANVTLSLLSSPKVRSPANVILPVECILPVEFQELWISIVPVPFGLSSILVLSVVDESSLASNFKFSVSIPVAKISPVEFKLIVFSTN